MSNDDKAVDIYVFYGNVFSSISTLKSDQQARNMDIEYLKSIQKSLRTSLRNYILSFCFLSDKNFDGFRTSIEMAITEIKHLETTFLDNTSVIKSFNDKLNGLKQNIKVLRVKLQKMQS